MQSLYAGLDNYSQWPHDNDALGEEKKTRTAKKQGGKAGEKRKHTHTHSSGKPASASNLCGITLNCPLLVCSGATQKIGGSRWRFCIRIKHLAVSQVRKTRKGLPNRSFDRSAAPVKLRRAEEGGGTQQTDLGSNGGSMKRRCSYFALMKASREVRSASDPTLTKNGCPRHASHTCHFPGRKR